MKHDFYVPVVRYVALDNVRFTPAILGSLSFTGQIEWFIDTVC